jgi:iron-sulfur cluster assembly protein
MAEIKLTERAILEIKQVMAEQGFSHEDYVLEVAVVGGGCSGFSYKLGFKERTEVDQSKVVMMNFDGFEAVVPTRAMIYLDGTTVDFHEDLNKRGFSFTNPQSTGRCGCGSSFAM